MNEFLRLQIIEICRENIKKISDSDGKANTIDELERMLAGFEFDFNLILDALKDE